MRRPAGPRLIVGQDRIRTGQVQTMADFFNTVLNWLSANSVLFGIPAQNWMLVVGAGLVLYIAVLIVAGCRHPRARASEKRQT